MLRFLILLNLFTRITSFYSLASVSTKNLSTNKVILNRSSNVVLLHQSEPTKDEASLDAAEEEANELQQQKKSVEVEEKKPYPLDIPSPVLLSSSMVLAIASTGSIFELTSGAPQLGFAVTASIALLGFPTFVFLFYAALLKGAAETEEDDKEFRKSDGFY